MWRLWSLLIMILSPDKTLAFKTVVNCGFPCVKEVVTVIVHVETKVYIVPPDCRVAVDAICRMVCCASRVLFRVHWSWWRVVWRIHPELVFVVPCHSARFGVHGVVFINGSSVGGGGMGEGEPSHASWW
jgi:hypothetical protein